jgi:broad specificity phosphatase PhoE
MKVIIVRHGETFENAHKICQGQMNSQLNEIGINQAKKVAKRLRTINIDRAYSSDLDRALHTCQSILSQHKSIPLTISKLIREKKRGVWEGKSHQYSKEIRDAFDGAWYECKPEGGESTHELYDRVVPYFKMILKKEKVDNLLIVSHGGPIQCMISFLRGQDFKSEKIPVFKNTSVTIFDWDGENATFEVVNDVSHLILPTTNN